MKSLKKILLTAGLAWSSLQGFSQSPSIHFSQTTGDKISLFGNRLGLTTMYGIGVGDLTMYSKTNGNYAWLLNQNVSANDGPTEIYHKSHMSLWGGQPGGTLLTLREPLIPNAANSGELRMLETGSTNPMGGFIRYDGQGNNLVLGTYYSGDRTDVLFIARNHNVVGIGTSAPHPDYLLSVNGKIRAKEVRVESNWADYVFEPGYELPTLDSVETFIQQNGHLPGVPSAATISSEGLDLGTLEALMMQKIEELTLYLIELKKENDVLKAKLEN